MVVFRLAIFLAYCVRRFSSVSANSRFLHAFGYVAEGWKAVVLGYCHLTATCDGVHLVAAAQHVRKSTTA